MKREMTVKNEAPVRDQAKAKGLKIKTQVKAGIQGHDDGQHNETLVHVQTKVKSLKVKTKVKAGAIVRPTGTNPNPT